MVKIQFTGNFLMTFLDPQTKKKQWYECDIMRGETMVFKDVVSANEKELLIQHLDGELSRIPLVHCIVLECSKVT